MYDDRQGSVIWVTDPSSGAVLAAYKYDGFGAPSQTQGTLVQPYGYTGREYDGESGLYHYRARSYDPKVGKFLQSDPIGFVSGTLSLYTMVDNKTFNLSDPTGLSPTWEFGQIQGRSEANGVAAVTTIGMAAISRIADAFAAVRTGPGNPVPGSGGGAAEGFCGAAQLKSMNGAINQANSEMLGQCQMLPRNIQGHPAARTRMNMINLKKMQRYCALVLARHAINEICFEGGNAGHIKARNDALKGMRNCWSIINYNTKKPVK